jgi:uncharacterized protein (DUF952 family)
MILYHITSEKEWLAAQVLGEYFPADYAKDGFIHCSKREQVLKTAKRFYAGKTGLVLLKIDSDKLSARVEVENLDGGEELFPHIYGPLATSAVVNCASLFENSDQGFLFPPSVE